jgi:hypothetical protein
VQGGGVRHRIVFEFIKTSERRFELTQFCIDNLFDAADLPLIILRSALSARVK